MNNLPKYALSAILMISGCANPISPDTRVEYVQVEKPVKVPCRTSGVKKPDDIISTLKPTDDIFVKVKYLLAAKEQRDGYVTELETAVSECNESK